MRGGGTTGKKTKTSSVVTQQNGALTKKIKRPGRENFELTAYHARPEGEKKGGGNTHSRNQRKEKLGRGRPLDLTEVPPGKMGAGGDKVVETGSQEIRRNKGLTGSGKQKNTGQKEKREYKERGP